MTEYQIVETAVVVACKAAKLLTSDKALDEYCEAPRLHIERQQIAEAALLRNSLL